MNLLDLIMNDSDSQVVGQLAKRAGVPESEISNILAQAVPAVSRGMKSKMADENGLSSIMDILKDKQPERYVEKSEELATDKSVVDDGNSILGEIFGNKDTSREVASRVATKAGSSSGVVKMLLPIIASLAMGALSKKGKASAAPAAQESQSSGMMGMVKTLSILMMTAVLLTTYSQCCASNFLTNMSNLLTVIFQGEHYGII